MKYSCVFNHLGVDSKYADCFGFVIQVNFMSAQMIAASSGKKDDTAGKLNFLFYTLQPALEVEDHPNNSTLSLENHPDNSTLCNHLLKTTLTILHFEPSLAGHPFFFSSPV